MKRWRVFLLIVAVACFGVALNYQIQFHRAQSSNENTVEALSALRASKAERAAAPLVQLPLPPLHFESIWMSASVS